MDKTKTQKAEGGNTLSKLPKVIFPEDYFGEYWPHLRYLKIDIEDSNSGEKASVIRFLQKGDQQHREIYDRFVIELTAICCLSQEYQGKYITTKKGGGTLINHLDDILIVAGRSLFFGREENREETTRIIAEHIINIENQKEIKVIIGTEKDDSYVALCT